MIVECVSNFADCVTQRLMRALVFSPCTFEKLFVRNYLAGLTCEAHKYLGRLGRKMIGSCPAANLPLQWFDEQISEVETM